PGRRQHCTRVRVQRARGRGRRPPPGGPRAPVAELLRGRRYMLLGRVRRSKIPAGLRSSRRGRTGILQLAVRSWRQLRVRRRTIPAVLRSWRRRRVQRRILRTGLRKRQRGQTGTLLEPAVRSWRRRRVRQSRLLRRVLRKRVRQRILQPAVLRRQVQPEGQHILQRGKQGRGRSRQKVQLRIQREHGRIHLRQIHRILPQNIHQRSILPMSILHHRIHLHKEEEEE
ncbi:hypothetical protein PMAYCL1PPCAC_30052, partial [Pristionchus mayeri]